MYLGNDYYFISSLVKYVISEHKGLLRTKELQQQILKMT